MHSVIMGGNEKQIVLCLIYHGDSFNRIQGADPSVVRGSDLMSLAANFIPTSTPFAALDILICYEEDQPAFEAKCRELRNSNLIIKYLCRNWTVTEDEKANEGNPVIKVINLQTPGVN